MVYSKWRMAFGLLLVFFGAFFLLVGVFDWRFNLGDVIEMFWPLALIAIGIYLLGRHRRWHRPGRHTFSKAFGDLDLGGSDLEPDGINADLGFGDIRIDLTQATFAEKENRVYAQLGIGDIKIIVPEDLPLRAKGNVGVGDVHLLSKTSHGLGCQVTYESKDYRNERRKVYIKASVGIGDIIVTHP